MHRPFRLLRRDHVDDFTRGLAIAALTAIAVTHFADLPDKVEEAPYMALLFELNIVASVALAGVLIAGRGERWTIDAGAVLAALTLFGYVLSRSVGLPQIEDHVGHWLDPAGVAAAIAEITMIGLAVPALEREHVRLGFFVALPTLAFVGIATAAGQRFEGHAAGHLHGTAAHAVAGHTHGTGQAAAGHTHAGGQAHAQYPNLQAATAGDRARATRLMTAVDTSARDRFPTYDAALRQGYVPFKGRPWKRPLAFHVRSTAAERDGRVLDPQRPESLVYWWPRTGRPLLIAMMFRVTSARPADAAGSVPIFHRHANPVTGAIGSTAMTHVWLTGDLRTAYANCLPVPALQRSVTAFRYAKPGYIQAHETLPCTAP